MKHSKVERIQFANSQNYNIMILLALTIIASSINDDPVLICFYDVNATLCPPFARSFKVSNFSDFITADIPTSEKITFEFHASTSLNDVINISRFDESKLKNLEFVFLPDESKTQPEFTLSTSNKFVPSNMILNNVRPTFDFNTNFTELFLLNSVINIPGKYITAKNLNVDADSLKNIDTITSDSILFNNVFGDQSPRSFVVNSFSEKSTIQFVSISSLMLKASIVLSKLLFENQHNTTLISFDFSNWYGNVTIKYGSLKELFMTLECLAHSPYHHFPFLSVDFANQLQLPKSNWPNSTKPLIQITAMSVLSFSNKIVISGFIPAHILTGPSDLTISPTIISSGFMKLTMQNSNLSISQPLLFTENYYFFINELATTKKEGNTTIYSNPPLMYVCIDKFTENPNSKTEFQLIGSANYILKNLPAPNNGFAPTVYVEHLWFENNVTFNFNLQDGAPSIRVLDFVLMQTWPTYFIPLYTGKNQMEEKAVDQKKFKLICAKLLKEQKEQLMLPPSGLPRGYNRGASIVHSYYEQDPTTNQTLKCFGLDIHGDVSDVSNIFCLADANTKSKCPPDSQFIGTDEKWQKYVTTDAGELTFYLFREASLEFANFSMVNVSVIGSESSEKVSIEPTGVDHLSLTNLQATILNNNRSVNVELTNTKLTSPGGRYEMGPLKTDPFSLKSIENREELDVQVTVKNVPDTKITINKKGGVTLTDSGVTYRSKIHQNDQNITSTLFENDDENMLEPASFILINSDVSEIVFTFEEGSGESIFNNSIVATFSNSTQASFSGLSHASRFFVLDGFSGTLDFDKEITIPIDLINGHDIKIKTSTKEFLTFQSEVDFAGTFVSDVEIRSNHARVMPGSEISVDPTIKANHFVVMENAAASMKSLSVKDSLNVYPGSYLNVQETDEIPQTLTVHYNLENLPSVYINANSKSSKLTDKKINVKRIIFSYEDDKFNTAIMNRTALFKDGIEIVSGTAISCSSTSFDFQSTYAYYYGIYSLITAKCVGDDHNSVKLYVNDKSTAPPEPTPAPLIPTATPEPNNTRQQVVIISMTVVTFFMIIVIVIIKCMNRKKKYVSKNQNKNLDTQPMLQPNEGNAE